MIACVQFYEKHFPMESFDAIIHITITITTLIVYSLCNILGFNEIQTELARISFDLVYTNCYSYSTIIHGKTWVVFDSGHFSKGYYHK